MAKQELLILDQPVSCHENPRCHLGESLTNSSVQIDGAPALEVFAKKREEPPEREFPLFIIAEAPGAEEDRLGLPFVGRAGDVLRDIITRARLKVDDVFITNITRCRPPGNRTPNTQEVRGCLTHLYQEIRTHRPRVIVLLGSSALKLFNLNRFGGLKKIRGKLFEKQLPLWPDGPVFKVIPTYHPAFFLHAPNPRLQARVVNDLELAADALEGQLAAKPEIYPVKYKACLTLEGVKRAAEEIRAHGGFAFDTESPDIRFRTSPMILLQMSIGLGRTWVFPFHRHAADAVGPWKMRPGYEDEKSVRDILVPLFEDAAIDKIGANLAYDMNVVKRWLGADTNGRLFDAACLHHLLDEYPPHEVEHLGDVEFLVGDYSAKRRAITGHGKKLVKTFDHVPDEILWPYGATDAEVTYRLWEKYWPMVRSRPNLERLYRDEVEPAIRVFQEAQWNGVKVVRENIDKLRTVFETEIKRLLQEIQKIGGPTFNPNSHKQVPKLLIQLGFEEQVKDEDSASGYCADKEVLHSISHPIAEQIIRYRNLTKMLGTYVNNIASNIDDDGRVRYGFNLHGTVNGRQSCSVLHQIPRIDEEKAKDDVASAMRAIFGEEEGYSVVYLDFSQVEICIFSYLTNDPKLVAIIEEGRDIHREVAAAVLELMPEKVSKANRTLVGKKVVFGTTYGSKGARIAVGEFENPETKKIEIIGELRATQFTRRFRTTYPGVDKFMRAVPAQARRNGGLLQTVFGRERHIRGLDDPKGGIRGHAEREATNAMIQSPAASITTRTACMVRATLQKYNIGLDQVRFLMSVHDSLIYGVRNDIVPWFASALRTIAERPIPQISNRRFKTKVGSGSTWAAAELGSE